MFTLAWLVTGLVICWVACTLIERIAANARRAREWRRRFEPGDWLLWLFVAVLVLAMFAIGADSDSLSKELLSIKSIFIGPRFGPFLLGAIGGVLAFRSRNAIVDVLAETFDAVLGKADHPAWVLQSGVALALIAVFVVIIKPDLLDHITSVKAGGFEATFTARSATVRSARLDYSDLTEGIALALYSKFEKDYLGPDGPRGRARAWFDQLGGVPERVTLTKLLFDDYVDVVIKAVICLDENNERRMVLEDPDLVAYAAIWQRFILDLNDRNTEFLEKDLNKVLKHLLKHSRQFAARVKSFEHACREDIEKVEKAHDLANVSSAADAHIIWANFDLAQYIAGRADMREIRGVIVVDPYLAAAAGDLLAFLVDQKEKANFLVKALAKFPRSLTLMQPGVLNIFLQMSDAKSKSSAPWPINEAIDEINYAIDGADDFLARSVERIQDNAADRTNAREIYDVYVRNLIMLLTSKIEILNQRALADEAITPELRQQWMSAVSRLSAIMRARSRSPINGILVPASAVSATAEARLPMIAVPAPVDFDADRALALSAVLIEGNTSDASAQNCNAARFYLRDARNVLPRLAEDDIAAEARLRQWINLTAARVGASCGQGEPGG